MTVAGGPPIHVPGDAGQLDQLLIHLMPDAVEATAETDGDVRVGWTVAAGSVAIVVEDDGPGARGHREPVRAVLHHETHRLGHRPRARAPIAEAHRAWLIVRNRRTGRGAEAIVTLPARAAFARAS